MISNYKLQFLSQLIVIKISETLMATLNGNLHFDLVANAKTKRVFVVFQIMEYQ